MQEVISASQSWPMSAERSPTSSGCRWAMRVPWSRAPARAHATKRPSWMLTSANRRSLAARRLTILQPVGCGSRHCTTCRKPWPTLYDLLQLERDYREYCTLQLNPWLKNLGRLGTRLPPALSVSHGNVPSPYKEQIEQFHKTQFGRMATRRDMRKASHASSNDGATPRIYGHSVLGLMESHCFARAVILAWTGQPPMQAFEPELVEQTLIAALTNGPGTISAQAAKLSASAGNSPHTAMIATLASVGDVHGGNGREAVAFLIDVFTASGSVILTIRRTRNWCSRRPARPPRPASREACRRRAGCGLPASSLPGTSRLP